MKPKVLVIDDDEGIRESLRLILEDDFDTTIVETEDECFKHLAENPTDAILLDIKMPRTSGLDILKKIKSLRPNIKIVMMTGYRAYEVAEEAIKLGADDYIVKPFDSKAIVESIKRLLTLPS